MVTYEKEKPVIRSDSFTHCNFNRIGTLQNVMVNTGGCDFHVCIGGDAAILQET